MQKLSVCDQQFGCRILQHIHQSVLRIRWIERLIGCTGFDNAHRRNGHILTAGNQNRHDIFCTNSCDGHVFAAGDQNGNYILLADSLGCNIFSKPVTDLIQFFISELLVLKYNSRMFRYSLYHFRKSVGNSFRPIIFTGSIIEFCNLFNCILWDNGNLWNVLVFQYRVHSCLICVQHTVYKSITVHVTAEFRCKHIFIIVLSYLDKQRHFRHIKGKIMSPCNGITNRVIVT